MCKTFQPENVTVKDDAQRGLRFGHTGINGPLISV